MAKRRKGGGKRFKLEWANRSAVNKLERLEKEGIRQATFKVVKETTEDLLEEVRRTTPVDTGKARKAWRKRNPSRSARVPTGRVRNFAPYINVLEAGGSKQAPNGILLPALKKAEPKYARDLQDELQREFDRPEQKR